MVDAVVQVAPDGTGKAIDAQSLLSALATLVYRQTVTHGDPNFIANVQAVDAQGQAVVRDNQVIQLMGAVLVELQVLSHVLHGTQNSRDDLDALRTEFAAANSQSTS